MIRNINPDFFKSVVLTAIFLIIGFSSSPASNYYVTNNVIVKVEQESTDITVSVKSRADNKIEFYMFNIEGKLIKELNIQGSKRVNIKQLDKGLYTYDFFINDERLKSGNIELK